MAITKNRTKWESHKIKMIKELAKLERMNWNSDDAVAENIYPYILIEAINLLKNSLIVNTPVDYTKTNKDVEKMLNDILEIK